MKNKNAMIEKPKFLKPVLVCFILTVTSALYSADWSKEKEKDGITVFMRDVAGSNYREFRAQMTVNSSLSALVAVLDDTESYCNWIYKCLNASLLNKKQTSETDIRYIHTILDFSMLSSKRDTITRSVLTQNKETKTIDISLLGVPSFLPVSDDIVRIKKLTGFWKIEPKDSDIVEVTYQLHLEPGGNMTSWLVNSTLEDIGFETLKKMREMIKSSKYKSSKFDHIKEP
ncbi:MAG: START domain-containing protein [Spirochaetia bacterium]|nr:START domain-containing protein [Spirochaetia bacterium]